MRRYKQTVLHTKGVTLNFIKINSVIVCCTVVVRNIVEVTLLFAQFAAQNCLLRLLPQSRLDVMEVIVAHCYFSRTIWFAKFHIHESINYIETIIGTVLQVLPYF